MFNATTDEEMKRFSKNEWVNDFFNRDEFIKKSAEEGLELGIEQGTQNRNIEIAKNLLNMNLSVEDIAQATGLSPEEINALKNQTEDN